MFLEKSKSRIEAEFAKRAAEVPAVKPPGGGSGTEIPLHHHAVERCGKLWRFFFPGLCRARRFPLGEQPLCEKNARGDFPQLYPLSPDQHRGDPGLPEHFL